MVKRKKDKKNKKKQTDRDDDDRNMNGGGRRTPVIDANEYRPRHSRSRSITPPVQPSSSRKATGRARSSDLDSGADDLID